jgi:phosphoribosyl 1,2-cyclic phosphodiesterase/ActR/RegA family two-component response regulator
MTQPSLHFLVIDDSKTVLLQYIHILKAAGHEATTLTSGEQALEKVLELQPDCIICDLILPGMDGLELFKTIRGNKTITKQPTFIVVSGKQFEYDRRRALELGVDAYFTKPINLDTFVNDIVAIIDGKMTVEFWGVRGTLPVAGQRSLRYGGNTNCITLTCGNNNTFIFDAGTGIKELSNYLLKKNQFPFKAKIFISHPHYDHINGIPFFVPLYMKGNEFVFYGPDQPELNFKDQISNQMDSVYFPVTIKEFSSTVSFHSLTEEKIQVDDTHIETLLLNHPGRCLGYRVEYKGKVCCYITDNELFQASDTARYNQFEVDRLINFINNADMLIIDTTYTDKEYAKKIGWGHSSLTSVVEVADKAKVKLLCLHHHDPDQSDDDIDAKLKQAQEILQSHQSTTKCIAPHEGDKITI